MARIFDNGALVGTAANLGKYYFDSNDNGSKDIPCTAVTPSANCDSYVDTWHNFTEGDQKGKYTPLTNAQKLKVKPQAQKPVIFGALYDFGKDAAGIELPTVAAKIANFKTKVDNSVAGEMRDCAECHVGGGAMEYVPVAEGTPLVPGARTELRDDPAMVTTGYNAFNYFIDQYDEDGDNILGEVLPQKYADTGVLEMDCLVCHLDGYSWDDRAHAIRKGNFDASRVAGAGLGTADNADGSLNLNGVGAGTGFGKKVTYNPTMVVANAGNNATLSPQVLNAIEAQPPSANCSACHMDMHKVDWKKRGDTWHKNMAYETEVHGSIGCIGCHTRDDGMTMDPNNTLAGTEDNPLWTGSAAGDAAGATQGHDPSKGNAPYSSLWNNNDNTVRTCAGCHTKAEGKSYYGFGGAPDPTFTHAQLGLTQRLVQKGGMTKMTGVADGSHLDVITCEACHTKKVGHGPVDTHSASMYEWGTGGALVDATGTDADGRLTDHENLYVERTMENNLTVAWQGNKISTRNALVSMFWLDKDDTGVDINADGQAGGMDAVNASHVRDAMKLASLDVLTHDGFITDGEITAQKNALNAYLPTVGIPASSKLKLAFMGVMFKVNHGTTPAASAWGAGGCKDCHGVDKGFYNGPYAQKPRDLTASWVNTGAVDWSAVEGGKPGWKQVVPFTAVNNDNYSGRDLAVPICSSYYGPNARPALPETPAQAAARLNPTVTDPAELASLVPVTGAACAAPGTIGTINYGTAAGTWTVYALGAIKADQQFTDYHPTTWAKGQTGRSIAITTASGTSNTIRTMDRSEGLWEAEFKTGTYDGTITGTDKNKYATRAAWVTYLNSVGQNYTAYHNNHAQYKCSTCHYAGTSNSDTVVTAGHTIVPDPTVTSFTSYTPRPGTGTGTCATTCHDAAAAGAPNKKATARIDAKHSAPTNVNGVYNPGQNYTVNLDGSKSACYGVDLATGEVTQGTATYTWSFPANKIVDVAGVPTTVPNILPTNPSACTSGNPASCTASWLAGGTNAVKLDVSCDSGNGTVTDDVTVNVTGFDIGAGAANDASGLVTSMAGNVVTVSAPTLDPDVAFVNIQWGDFTQKNVTPAELKAGVTHAYKVQATGDPVAAESVYKIMVTTTNDGKDLVTDVPRDNVSGNTTDTNRYFYTWDGGKLGTFDVAIPGAPLTGVGGLKVTTL